MLRRVPPLLVAASFSVAGLTISPESVRPQEARSLSLEQGIELALQNNEILRMAREDLEKARKQVWEARADALPQITASGTYLRNWKLPTFVFGSPPNEQEVTIGTKTNVEGILSLRQTLFAWGKVSSGLKVARLFRDYSEEGLRSVRQKVHSDVELAFYDLMYAEDLVRVSNLAMQRTRENLRRVQRLRDAGHVSGYDLLRAQVALSALRPDSIKVANDRLISELHLKNTIGLDAETPLKLSGELRSRTRLDVTRKDALIQLGLDQRPEMRQFVRLVQMRRQAIRIAQADARPTIDLTASGRVQMQSNDYSVNTDEAKQSWTTGLTLTYPLFDGLRTRARVLQARAELCKAELELQSAERAIALQIRQALLNFKMAQERLMAQELTVGEAQRGVEIARSRYANGLGTQLELLDAELVLLRAEVAFAQERRGRAAALVGLEMAVGVVGEAAEPASGSED